MLRNDSTNLYDSCSLIIHFYLEIDTFGAIFTTEVGKQSESRFILLLSESWSVNSCYKNNGFKEWFQSNGG